jgi:hypothetical protein
METPKIKGWIYFHIPKTAGLFINSRISESKNTSKILTPFIYNSNYNTLLSSHPTISFVRKHLEMSNDERIGFFTTVRNPYDRIYSLWKWSRRCGSSVSLEFPDVEENFEDFVISLDNGKYDINYFMQKQIFFLKGGEDRHVKIIKFENLNTEGKIFLEENGVTWSDIKVNVTPGINYIDAYTTISKNIVKEKYKEEFELFNYSLDL